MPFKATPITDDYHYGKLGDFKVIIRTADEYINITKLCKMGKKEFSNWKRLDGSKELLEYYDKSYMDDVFLECLEDENGAPPYMEGQEYKCLSIINNGDIPGLTKDQIQRIQGTYVPSDIAIQVAQWISCEFALKVSEIVRGYYLSDLKLKNKELDSDSLEALIRSSRDETKKENMELKAEQVTTNKKLTKLQEDVSSVKELLKNQEYSNEVLVYYRKKDEDKSTFHVRAGELSKLRKYFDEEEDDVTIYANLSNAKYALRKCKFLGYLPRNNTSTFEIKDSSIRKSARKFFVGLNTTIEHSGSEGEQE